jgi:SAM-dependent methyltransferase
MESPPDGPGTCADQDLFEISDMVVAYDPGTLERIPVVKQRVVDAFRLRGNRRAASIVEAYPARPDGVLDEGFVDDLLVRVHCEMQRISEEFQHGQRVAELLRPLLAALREGEAPRPRRVVDIGCGTGYVVRWLAARAGLGGDVELVGVDLHRALVDEARRLASVEGLGVRFVAADAFAMDEPASVYLTTGVVHHFRGRRLAEFFRRHDREGTQAFAHFDFQPSPLAALGAWLFHAVRMREPLARHDGVLSAVRAHSGQALLEAAAELAPAFVVALYSTRLGSLPIPRSFNTVVGLRPWLRDGFRRHLGRRAARLGAFR